MTLKIMTEHEVKHTFAKVLMFLTHIKRVMFLYIREAIMSKSSRLAIATLHAQLRTFFFTSTCADVNESRA
jgi:hypothetical protein